MAAQGTITATLEEVSDAWPAPGQMAGTILMTPVPFPDSDSQGATQQRWEESREAERAEQRWHDEILAELRASSAEDQEDWEEQKSMCQSMNTSTNAIVDLTHAVTLLVKTIQVCVPVAEWSGASTMVPGAPMAELPWISTVAGPPYAQLPS
ncbi:UNVERIFIED_CONTAM: hypothetical protein K2H54_052734 [Gekko kuhli]